MDRVFIGIPIDGNAQKIINGLVRPMNRSTKDIRWAPQENRHLTLAFLGLRSESEIARLVDLFDQAYQRQLPFQLCFLDLQRFPDSRSRIVALTGPVTEPLQQLLLVTRDLITANRIEIEEKKFRPHITLGRIRRGKNIRPAIDQKTDIAVTVSSVALYQSTLTETGSIYRRLKETSLGQ
jgi:2'-5' RNA ligase